VKRLDVALIVLLCLVLFTAFALMAD